MQVRVAEGFDPADLRYASFDLPGTDCEVKADVEVAWSDKRGNMGIRFVKIAEPVQNSLRLWLAQQYFAN